jgi:hypothetical protein
MTQITPESEAERAAKCRAKVRHVTSDAAHAAGRRRLELGAAPTLWVYHCNVCFGWHLTKRNRGFEWAVHDPNPFATIVK